MTAPIPFAIREDARNEKAIIFVHGFSGNAHTTFGMKPAFLAGHPDLYDWNLHCFGYSTGLSPDITGLWSSDPDISALAGALSQNLRDRWGKLKQVVLIAHSMGGLVVQRALLDGGFHERVHTCLLFGTPSLGLRKASFGRFFKRQAADMERDGAFITRLRADWSTKFASVPFGFAAVAGNNDQFVPPSSSLAPFHVEHRCHVFGNHLEMVKPMQRDADSVLLVVNRLTGQKLKPPTESRSSDPAKQLSEQALALELEGRESEAIALLEQNLEVGTDVMGTLAGRLKRRWLREISGGEPEGADPGGRARDLYADALRRATLTGNHPQAAYSAINCAFMQLALDGEEAARPYAERALLHARHSPNDVWSSATQAEALLYLRKPVEALATYERAYEPLGARERGSMFQQASWTARLLGETLVDSQLEAIRLAAG
jgi:pimeloyl-ACP methyl ester carboxylesterase